VRPLFLPRPRTFQRTSYRPGALCQFDLWEPTREIAVGSGQTRRGYVVVGCLPYSRAGAGTLVFSKEAPDLLYGIGESLAKLGALPEALVWDREGALHAGGGRPSEPFAAYCGQLGVGWRILEPKDPQSKGVVERLQGVGCVNSVVVSVQLLGFRRAAVLRRGAGRGRLVRGR
jgi:hypothetical protein